MADSVRWLLPDHRGGVGKTSMAASLAVKFTNRGEPTLIVSTVPHSLGDSFEQDMGGGKIVPVSGVDSLFATEIGHAKEEPFSHLSWIRGIMSRVKLGAIVDLNALHEMLHKAPVVFSELAAVAQLIKSVEEESNNFKRIVLDTVNTRHTLHLLSGTNWMEKSLGLLIKVMAVNESSRFRASLKKDGVLVRRLVVNQVLPSSELDCRFWASKRKEETRALNMISNGRELRGLELIKAPLLDVEVRGVPGLKFLGDAVWK